MLVLFTTIVFGALMPKFIQFFQSMDKDQNQTNKDEYNNNKHEMKESQHEHEDEGIYYDYLHPNFTNE
jgi:hypothetical protein